MLHSSLTLFSRFLPRTILQYDRCLISGTCLHLHGGCLYPAYQWHHVVADGLTTDDVDDVTMTRGR